MRDVPAIACQNFADPRACAREVREVTEGVEEWEWTGRVKR